MVFAATTRMICYQRSSSASFFIATPGGARHQKLCNFFSASPALSMEKQFFPIQRTHCRHANLNLLHIYSDLKNQRRPDMSRKLPSTSPTTQQDGGHFSIMMDMQCWVWLRVRPNFGIFLYACFNLVGQTKANSSPTKHRQQNVSISKVLLKQTQKHPRNLQVVHSER